MELIDRDKRIFSALPAEVVGARIGALFAGRSDLLESLPSEAGAMSQIRAESVVVDNMFFLNAITANNARTASGPTQPFQNLIESSEETIRTGTEALEKALQSPSDTGSSS